MSRRADKDSTEAYTIRETVLEADGTPEAVAGLKGWGGRTRDTQSPVAMLGWMCVDELTCVLDLTITSSSGGTCTNEVWERGEKR